MSRIGRRIIQIPKEVEVNLVKSTVEIKGPLGVLKRTFSPLITIRKKDDSIIVKRSNEEKHTKQLHGTTNSLLQSMIIGVTKGFKKELLVNGVGYKAEVKNNKLEIIAGYSHPAVLDIIEGVEVKVNKQVEIEVFGIDKQKVGQMAALIRNVRKPNPYSGKGIKYKDEVIRRKVGKAATSGGK